MIKRTILATTLLVFTYLGVNFYADRHNPQEMDMASEVNRHNPHDMDMASLEENAELLAKHLPRLDEPSEHTEGSNPTATEWVNIVESGRGFIVADYLSPAGLGFSNWKLYIDQPQALPMTCDKELVGEKVHIKYEMRENGKMYVLNIHACEI